MIFERYIKDGFGWFRIFGFGLHWKHKSKGLMFSERIGKTKYWSIGNYNVRILKKNNI
jgi:hypothetical protein